MIPRGVEYIVLKTDISTEAVAVDAVAQVVSDLLLSGEAAAPGRVEFEGEGVQLGGNIAGTARVAVSRQVPPTSAARSSRTKSVIPC